jgi:cobalt-zinc-cadmium efflux system outer membrane protein
VRLAHAALQIARARIAEYRDVLIPQRVETVARAQEEVNFMLIGIFELIALKQDEYAAYEGYLDAIRDYWIARAELGLAVGAELPGSARADDTRFGVDEFLRPAPGGMDHSAHSGAAQKLPKAESEQRPAKMPDHSMHMMNQQKQVEPSSGDHASHDMNDAGGSDAPGEVDNREHDHDHDNEGGEL